MICLALTFTAIPPIHVARADDIPSLKEEIRRQQELLKEQQRAMEQLRLKMIELEERLKSQESAQKGMVERTAAIEERQGDSTTPGHLMEEIRSVFGLNLGALGDITYSSESRERANNSFALGELGLFSTATFDRLIFLIEMQLEMERDATELDIERMLVGYTFNDLLTLRAGRQHTALGYWNKTYHHGKQLFTTIDRPFFLAFEHGGGIIPMHVVGLELEGAVETSSARLKYELQVGNNPRISNTKLKVNNAGDDRNSKQAAFRLSALPSAFPGLNAGISGTTYQLDTTGKGDLRESVIGLHLAYQHSSIEFLSEYFRMHNSDGNADAFYVQLGYTFGNAFTSYVRYEYLNIDEADPYFMDLNAIADREQAIVGVKYDIDAIKSSIKVQYRHDEQRGGSTYNVFETQWSFKF